MEWQAVRMVAIEECKTQVTKDTRVQRAAVTWALNMRFAPLVAGLGGRYKVEGPASDFG